MAIDDLPLQTIDRNVLRSRVIALPQDTFLLPDGNSYHANLDPCGEASPNDCEAVLDKVGLWALIKERGGLNEPMKADSLSQGQKKLFGIASAVLRARVRANRRLSHDMANENGSSKLGGILLLDEVATSVDSETGDLIQRIIRQEFEGYTVISVTHSEHSVRDFDRMIVMEGGIIQQIRNLTEDGGVAVSPS